MTEQTSEAISNERVSFTVPASRRRYTIWLEDWHAIQTHISIAELAQKKFNHTRKADTDMNSDRKAAILINDLDSAIHLIEDLPANPNYTTAQELVTEACEALKKGRSELHQADMEMRLRPSPPPSNND